MGERVTWEKERHERKRDRGERETWDRERDMG